MEAYQDRLACRLLATSTKVFGIESEPTREKLSLLHANNKGASQTSMCICTVYSAPLKKNNVSDILIQLQTFVYFSRKYFL